jgi:hypothetical protein
MSDMEELQEFAEQTSLKNNELLAGIFVKIMHEYPDETDRQHLIRAAVMQFEAQYKPEMRLHDTGMKRKREMQANEFASNDDIKMRSLFMFPETLMTRINMVLKDPSFLSDKAVKLYDEENWVRKEFPRYFVPEVY